MSKFSLALQVGQFQRWFPPKKRERSDSKRSFWRETITYQLPTRNSIRWDGDLTDLFLNYNSMFLLLLWHIQRLVTHIRTARLSGLHARACVEINVFVFTLWNTRLPLVGYGMRDCTGFLWNLFEISSNFASHHKCCTWDAWGRFFLLGEEMKLNGFFAYLQNKHSCDRLAATGTDSCGSSVKLWLVKNLRFRYGVRGMLYIYIFSLSSFGCD